MDSISSSENFVRAYNTALSVSSFETNQTASFIEGEIRQYISKKLAATLIDSINENCDVLNEAFIACNLNISGDQFKDSDVIVKKMKIIQDFFNDARIKIMNGLKII